MPGIDLRAAISSARWPGCRPDRVACGGVPGGERGGRRRRGIEEVRVLGLVVAHLVLACLLPLVSARSRRAGFAVAAVPPAAALVWALAHAPEALSTGVSTTLDWAPELGLALSFRLDALALAMVVLVSGIGALILVYCIGYFGEQLARRHAQRRAPARVRGRDARARPRRRPAQPVPVLGADVGDVVPARRAERRGAGEPQRRGAGAAGHRVRRAGDAARLRPARRGGGHLPDLGDRRARAGRRARRRNRHHGARPDPRRRADEVGAAALPPLAARRDGGADAR